MGGKGDEMIRCEACGKEAKETCGSLDEPMLGFCVQHFIEHVTTAHPPEYWLRARAEFLAGSTVLDMTLRCDGTEASR